MAEGRLYMDDKLYDAVRLQDAIPSTIDDEKLLRQVTPGDKSNALHVAARFGNKRFLEAIARDNPAFHCELLCKLNSKGETPLHLAAQFGHMDTVKTLLSFHHNADGRSPQFSHKKEPCWRKRDNQGDTPLHGALKYGHYDIAQLLIEQDMQLLSLYNNVGESPAYLAADKFCSNFLLTILNADRENRCCVSFSGPFGQTTFHPARKLTGDIMSILIQRRKQLLKVQDNKGKTVLHYAVEEKRESMVETLLKNDSSLAYLHDNDGFTPLHRAANMGSFAMVETILDLSPQSIEIREQRHGKTALHVAKMESCFLVQCLRKTRMKELINEVDNDGNTPLHLALINDNLESADALLEVSGINWSFTNKQGDSPMDLCKSDDKIPVKMKFLASGWRVNMEISDHKGIFSMDDVLKLNHCERKTYRSPSGDSILHIAAREGSMKIIREFLAIDSRLLLEENTKGENPLHLAAEYGKFEVVKEITPSRKSRNWVNRHGIEDSRVVMMENGESNQAWRMNSRNGDTPTHRALRNGHDNIALHLLHLAPELVSSSINNEDESLLYLAAENNCFNALKEIVLCKDKEHSYSISGPNGETPLHAAARKGGLKSVKYLSEKRQDLLNMIDHSGKTPLHHAVENDRHTVVKELLSKQDKSTAFVYDNEGFTPLLRAADMGFEQCVSAILKLCPLSAEHRDLSNNRTLLHLVKFPGYQLKSFMKHQNGAKWINETDGDGNTPLHSAIIDTDKYKENTLLETKGINWRIRNKQQQMPFDLCKNLDTNAAEKQKRRYRVLRYLRYRKQSFLEYYFSIIRRKSRTVHNPELMTENELKQLLNGMAVLATLLVTITFAALFTIPGGYESKTGEATAVKKNVAIQAFVAADAFALFTGVGVLIKYAYTVLYGPRHCRRELAAGSIVLLQYSLGATTLAFVFGLYAVVSKSAIWIFVGSFAVGLLCAAIP